MANSDILIGFSDIINKNYADPDTDLGALERMLDTDGTIDEKDRAEIRQFKEKIKQIADDESSSDTDDDVSISPITPQLDLSDKMPQWSSVVPPQQERSEYVSHYNRTDEQFMRAKIDSVIPYDSRNVFSFEREKREDEKCALLEEISQLECILASEGDDVSRIPRVTQDSSYDEIINVVRVLRYKVDRNRFSTMAEELIQLGALGLEELFDGKRTWFNQYKPDLTGYHKQLAVKLRRVRLETSKLVSGLVEEIGAGPLTQLAIELVPNAILYARSKSKEASARARKSSSSNMFEDESIADATAKLRDMDSK